MRFDLDRLPTDPVLLQKMLREMAEAMEVDRDELKVTRQTVKAQCLTIEKLEHRLARLLRAQFGRSSEKMDSAQLRMMFEDVEVVPEPANDDAAALKPEPVRKAGTRAPIPAHIPRLTAEHRPEPCGCGGVETVICEDVTEVLDYVPARFRVLRHVRPRIACRSCETIRQVPAIDLPLPKVMASSALLAHLVVSRFVDHQPWHRQPVILRRQGVTIDRDVMGRWARKLAWLMAPLGERLLAHILQAPKIHGDETPVTLLMGEDGSHTAYFWVYLRDGRSSGDTSPPAVAFRFTTGRGGEHPAAHLAGYEGYLQADGYGGYNVLYRNPKTKALRSVTEVGCWAHLWMPPLLQGLSDYIWQYPRLQSSIRPVVAKRPALPALMVNPQAGSQSRATSSKLDAPNGSMPAPVRPVLPSYSERSSHPRRPYRGRTRCNLRPLVALDYRRSRHSVGEPKQPSPSCSQGLQSRCWLDVDRANALTTANSALASA